MARTNKTTNSNRADDHLGREQRLRKDSIEQTASHTNKIRAKKGLPPQQIIDPIIGPGSADDEVNNLILDDAGDLELLQDAGLIVGLRAYSSSGRGAPVGEDKFVGIHRQVRRERARYRELNCEMVEVGDLLPRSDKTRRVKTRTVPGILKSIMVRLMPAEAQVVGEMTRGQVEAAMDKTVVAFEEATGCEVVTAVVHRMSLADLHIHIQYTMVHCVEESKHMLGRRLKPWKQEASKRARESLFADGVPDPSPSQIGARKKKLVADGQLVPPPEAGIEYRKVAGKRDLGDGAILGYSFRQKLNLVRAAELGGEMELAKQVARRNDERWGRFTPIANRPDEELDAKYLDLWLERIWRRNITSLLPENRRDRLVLAGVEAAQNYANFGSSVVEDTHIKRRIKELDERAREIETAEKDAEAKRSAWEAKMAAAEEGKRLAERLSVEKRTLEEQVNQQKEKLEELESQLAAAANKPPVEKIVKHEVIKEIEKEVVPQRLLDDAAALRDELDEVKVQVDQSATLITNVQTVLKPNSGETLLAAASRVTAGAAEAVALKKQVVDLRLERDHLQTERDRFKTMADQSSGLLERIRAMLGLNPDADIVPAVKRTVGAAVELPELKKQMGVLEKEIAPLRLLKKLFAELIAFLNKPGLFDKLPNGVQKRLKVMADSVAIKIEMPGQEMK